MNGGMNMNMNNMMTGGMNMMNPALTGGLPQTSFGGMNPALTGGLPQTSFGGMNPALTGGLPQTSFGGMNPALTGGLPQTSFGAPQQQPFNNGLQPQPTGYGFGNTNSNSGALNGQPTGGFGRQANLANATAENPFGF
jgi:hypothetical protein